MPLIENSFCKLRSKCKYDKDECLNPIFIIPGYREKDMKYDNEVKFNYLKFDNMDTYACYLTYEKCKYNIDCIVDELDKTISKITDDKVNLIGLCFGGNVAMKYSAKHKDKVNKMALIYTGDLNVPKPISKLYNLKYIDNARKTLEFDKVQKEIETPTLVYSCLLDLPIFGSPPLKIKNMKFKQNIFCVHGEPTTKLKSEVQSFFNKTI